MQTGQSDAFDRAVSRCRAAYAEFQHLASRTDAALYQALGQVYSLQCEMGSNSRLQVAFAQLVECCAARPPINQALLLVKYTFFSDTLEPGPGHKPAITKASRYAKLINKAVAANIAPGDFVGFAREAGVQRTAAGSPHGRGFHVGKRAPRRGRTRSQVVSLSEIGAFLKGVVSPLQSWFYTADLASGFRNLLSDATRQPRRVVLTVYLNHERAVVTGFSARPVCAGAASDALIGQGARARISKPSSRPVPF